MLHPSYRLALFIAASALLACTTPNPLDCSDGTCTDPAHPFCDVDGSLGGTEQSCVAVTCTPGTFAACRGDSALTCNAAGTSYDIAQCADGCAPDIGCRLCQANQTVCTNGTMQTCDTNGTITASQACALGCFEDQPRCSDIDPSNKLATYLDMAVAATDLTFADGTIDISKDVANAVGYDPVQLHGFTIAAPLDGVPIHVIPLRSLSLSGTVRIVASAGDPPALAFVVAGPVEIAGRLIIGDDVNEAPGAVSTGDCVGDVGLVDVAAVGYFVGSGGGGAANKGGDGGAQFYPARKGGASFANPDLQPLRGGCDGGRPRGAGSSGGGAIEITSRTKIHLGVNASIEANGQIGYAGVSTGIPDEESIPGGGGGGGAILLEALEVALDSGAVLAANGGAGTSGLGDAGTPASGSAPSIGRACTNTHVDCTKGGDGGASTISNTDAPSVSFTNQQQIYTGAGGGAIGYIRINTTTGAYSRPGDVYESPTPSTSLISTR